MSIESAFVNSVLVDERERDRLIQRRLLTVTQAKEVTTGTKTQPTSPPTRETMVRRISGFRIWGKNNTGTEQLGYVRDLCSSIRLSRLKAHFLDHPCRRQFLPNESLRESNFFRVLSIWALTCCRKSASAPTSQTQTPIHSPRAQSPSR